MISWLKPASGHFDHTVRAYSAQLFQYAFWLCRDRHRAEDILQEAFARAWQAWDKVTDEAARRSWLYTIVRNEFLRGAGKAGEVNRGAVVGDGDDDGAELPDIADERDFTRGVEIRDALERLPSHHLEPLLLQNLVGMPCEEIAAVLGVNVGTAMTRLTRARIALREIVMAGEGPATNPANEARPRLRVVQNGNRSGNRNGERS